MFLFQTLLFDERSTTRGHLDIFRSHPVKKRKNLPVFPLSKSSKYHQRFAIKRFIPVSKPSAESSYMGNIWPSFQWVWPQ